MRDRQSCAEACAACACTIKQPATHTAHKLSHTLSDYKLTTAAFPACKARQKPCCAHTSTRDQHMQQDVHYARVHKSHSWRRTAWKYTSNVESKSHGIPKVWVLPRYQSADGDAAVYIQPRTAFVTCPPVVSFE